MPNPASRPALEVVPIDVRAAELERRFGRVHCRLRLGIEDDHEARKRRRWYFSPVLIRTSLQLTGLYWRARRNAARIEIRRQRVVLRRLPAAFDGFTILQISDLHADISPAAMHRLAELLPRLDYDLCVLTGDYRGRTHGPFEPTLASVAKLRRHIAAPAYGVLGNHDSLHMAPAFEAMGIRMLVNEAAPLIRGGARLHLAGIDDAHYYRTHNIEKTMAAIPPGDFAILLSHTPEIYRQAAHAGFDLLLSGHTHGGQICLPGAIPLTLDSVLPRHMGRGSWSYAGMVGYTSAGVGSSIVSLRLNCPPEITLHELHHS
jgi:predicted MPP superfamily phosphohydrolase